MAAKDRGHAKPDVPAPHFGKADRGVAAIHFVLHVLFPAANFSSDQRRSRFHSRAFMLRSRWTSKMRGGVGMGSANEVKNEE